MPWIDVVEPQEATGELASVYKEIMERRGQIANVYKIQSLNPQSLRAHLDLYMSILFRRGGLKRAQREMIGVVVSALNRCDYCVVHHSEALARHERSLRVLQKLRTDYADAPLSEADRRMLDYCARLTHNPADMQREDVENLRGANFTDSEILDITLIASYFNFVNRVVLGLNVDLEVEGGSEHKYRD